MKYNRLKEELRKTRENENNSKNEIKNNDNNDIVTLKQEFKKILLNTNNN